jgi:hypothetical protein
VVPGYLQRKIKGIDSKRNVLSSSSISSQFRERGRGRVGLGLGGKSDFRDFLE